MLFKKKGGRVFFRPKGELMIAYSVHYTSLIFSLFESHLLTNPISTLRNQKRLKVL